MVQSIIYFISFLALWAGVVLSKKSDEKKNIIVELIKGGFLVLAAQSFAAGVLGIVHLPVSALTIGLGNVIFSILICVWIKKKGIQHFYIKILDIVAVATIALLIYAFAMHRYGKDFHINFVSVDASVHCKSALTVALEHKLPNTL